MKKREEENDIKPAKRITLGELLDEYEKKITVNKKSADNESKRIKLLKRPISWSDGEIDLQCEQKRYICPA
ncbi:MAG: hypothetical protein ACTIKR_05525 [Advenella sp.]|uniref:Uncharacterized protein n=1 Tax=Advenella kashmirensis TaxID=310575 RepID=A0A356LE56_9BURK|nr:hypothetical protein [Advenella kashmirensis]